MKLVLPITILLVFVSFNGVSAWDNEDYEIFDLVELINQNFYTLMGITQVRNRYVDQRDQKIYWRKFSKPFIRF